MRRSVYNTCLARSTIAPGAARTANTTGATVDRMTDTGGFRSAMVIVQTGTITDGTFTVTVQDSPDGTTWSDVADEFLQGTEPAIGSADDNRVFEIGYVGHQRYLRANVAVTGSPVTGGEFGAVVVLGWPRKMPPERA